MKRIHLDWNSERINQTRPGFDLFKVGEDEYELKHLNADTEFPYCLQLRFTKSEMIKLKELFNDYYFQS